MNLLKGYISLASGFGLQICAIWLDWLERMELEMLQKVFYLLSIVLICIGIIQVLFKHSLKKKGKFINAIADTQQAKKIVELADDPVKKGALIVTTFHYLRKGGNKMKKFITDRGWIQIASFSVTIVLLALGIASAFVPELAIIGQNIEVLLAALGLAVVPGILANGKKIGHAVKDSLPTKERKLIESHIKEFNSKLTALRKKYAPIIELVEDIRELGGSLTPDQQTQYNTYATQEKSLKAKIDAEKLKLEVPKIE